MTDLELRQLCLAAAAGTHSVIPDPSGVYAATILLREALTPDAVLALLDRLDALRPLIAAAAELADAVLDPDTFPDHALVLARRILDLTTPKGDTP